jgi:transcriptional regulator with XRE-family HTH domain
MLSETLTEGLEEYEIGPTIRTLRVDKGLGLEQLGKHTGLSAAMLSRIERGQIFPTLPTLLRISMVFGVGLDHFFTAKSEKPVAAVVRAKDRLRMPNQMEGTPQFHFESLDFPVADRSFETFLTEFSDTSPTEPHTHTGAEFIYMIEGTLEVVIKKDKYRLETGDSMYFDPSPEHSYAKVGRTRCLAINVVSPD